MGLFQNCSPKCTLFCYPSGTKAQEGSGLSRVPPSVVQKGSVLTELGEVCPAARVTRRARTFLVGGRAVLSTAGHTIASLVHPLDSSRGKAHVTSQVSRGWSHAQQDGLSLLSLGQFSVSPFPSRADRAVVRDSSFLQTRPHSSST